jgi:hypothetical protein
MSRTSPKAVLDEISALPRGDDLARLVHTAAFAAADERRSSLADGVAELAEREGLAPKDAETPFGNALRALERGGAEASGAATRALLAGLLARGVALAPPSGANAESRVADALVWLAANTSVDALTAIDAALGDKASGLWLAVATLVRRIDEGGAPLLGRPGALIGAAALRESTSPDARREAEALASEVRDPIVKALLLGAGADNSGAPRDDGPSAVVAGELVSPPRGPVSLFLLGATGILAATWAARLVGRVALRYRNPAELRASPTGVTVKSRTELLGRTLREQEVVIPVESLARATREVRYPRLGLYAGLFALAMGSYFGIKNLIDGLRTVSFEIMGIGALLLAAGVALDLVLEGAGSGMRGKCRVVLVPRRGPALAMGEVDPAAADAALRSLKRAS